MFRPLRFHGPRQPVAPLRLKAIREALDRAEDSLNVLGDRIDAEERAALAQRISKSRAELNWLEAVQSSPQSQVISPFRRGFLDIGT